jgi:hypothetical protein
MLKNILKTTIIFLSTQLNAYATDLGPTDTFFGKNFRSHIIFNKTVLSNFNIASQQGNVSTGEIVNFTTPDDQQYVTLSFWPYRKYPTLDALAKRAQAEQDTTLHCQNASFQISSRTSSALIYEYKANDCGPNHTYHKTLSKLMLGKNGIYQFIYMTNANRYTLDTLNVVADAVINSYVRE